MRISDWSSDVCSSDLREMIRRQAVARRRFARVGVDRRNLETLGEGFDLTFGVTKVRNVAERDEVQAVAGRADFLVHLHPALQLRLVPVRQPYRSEEHTSELQSLMRISYAVFGLKKK